MSKEEQAKHAYFLALAAILGDKVYNFGELLAHKVLDSLKGTENAWLTDLLFVFNSGDVNKFRTMKPKWSSIPDLASHETRLYEKVCLLCLMEMAFRKEATERHIAFAEIAKETTLPLEQVELLVMKGLSQGLVRGKIDEVEQVVMLTWVQPRVLDKQQLRFYRVLETEMRSMPAPPVHLEAGAELTCHAWLKQPEDHIVVGNNQGKIGLYGNGE
mgnify:CR=1 FL=1